MIALQERGIEFEQTEWGTWKPVGYRTSLFGPYEIFIEMASSLGLSNDSFLSLDMIYLSTMSDEQESFRQRFVDLVIDGGDNDN